MPRGLWESQSRILIELALHQQLPAPDRTNAAGVVGLEPDGVVDVEAGVGRCSERI